MPFGLDQTVEFEDLEKSLSAKSSLPVKVRSNNLAGLKVLGLVADDTACGRYRIIHPFHVLKEHGAQADWVRVASLHEMLQYDFIVAQRQYDPNVLDMLEQAMYAGKIVLYEVDDDLHRVLWTSPAYVIYHPTSDENKSVKEFISRLYGATVSTEDLHASYFRFNKNIHVVKNLIDFSLRNWNAMPTTQYKDGTLVVGWAGGTTHQSDLEILDAVAPAILKKYPHVMWGMYTGIDLVKSFCVRNNLDPSRVHFEEPRHFMDYPAGLANFDIQLAPVVSCAFNACKSSLKVLESWAYKTPIVASKVAPYARLMKNGHGGYLAEGPAEWIDAISHLIEDKKHRLDMGQEGFEICYKDHSLDTSFLQWPEAWKLIGKNVQEGYFGPPELAKTSKHRYQGSPYQIWGRAKRNDPCPCGSQKKYKQCCVPAWG